MNSAANRLGVRQEGPGSIGADFARQADITPYQPAVVTDNGSVSFRQLETMARNMAAALESHNAASEAPIALLMSEGAPLYASMLAVAKLGRIFVPLEMSAPEAWVSEILTTSGAGILIADETTRSVAERAATGKAVVLDAAKLADTGAPGGPSAAIANDAPVCILFTSGSTGKPKGVVIGQHTLLHRAAVRAAHCRVGTGDRIAQLRSSTFAGGVHDLFSTLLSGATICPYDLKKRGLENLSAWLVAQSITGLPISSSVLRAWLGSLPEGFRAPKLKLVVAASESLYGDDLLRLASHLEGDWLVVHQLSSTETGTISDKLIVPTSTIEQGVIPVGRAVENFEIRLEDEHGNLVPDGEIGEIVVRGRYLARFYWNDADMTAQRFRPDPMDPTIRFFHTGDQGRRRPDGDLEYFGRNDRKIKLRGHSVELYEVEQGLRKLPGIVDAAVIVAELGDHRKRLVAYVTAKDGAAADPIALRTQLFASMPRHMVPSEIVVLAALPLTARGKVDRKALPTPEEARRRDKPARAPESEIERRLIAIWQEVLKQRDLGIDDDFFVIGGDSLQATQLILEIAERFRVVLSAEIMFGSACTIAGMAKEIERARSERIVGAYDAANREKPVDVDFARFEDPQIARSNHSIFWVDPRTSLRRAVPHAVLGKVVFNSQGYRNPEIQLPKPTGTIRLGFLGGSTTCDEFVSSNDAAWPHLTCESLRQAFPGKTLDYVNGGMPGFHLKQMAVLYNEYMSSLGCDAVVLWSNDLLSTTNYLARKKGVFHGAHFRPSPLARKNAKWMLVEKNLVVLLRLLTANFSAGKLNASPAEIGGQFEESLEDLVHLCLEKCPVVAIMTSANRVRRRQSAWARMRGGSTDVFFMPYMSYDGMLDAFEIIDDIVRKVGKRTGALVIEPRDHIPADSRHYLDSGHFRDPGSRILAGIVSDALAKHPPFRALMG